MASRKELLASVARIAKDYREGERGIRMKTSHVSDWIEQFPVEVRDPVLEELMYVFQKSYVSKSDVNDFLESVVTSPKLGGNDPKKFWERCTFLNIQQGGASQTELLDLFDAALEHAHNLALQECEGEDTYIYLDDAIFSGNRLKNDIGSWIASAPKVSTIHVIVIVAYTGGVYYAEKCINEAAAKARKIVNLHIWRLRELQNKKSEARNSDVLWLQSIPDDALVADYVKKLKAAGYPPTLRAGNSVGSAEIFSSPSGRTLLEQEFLKAGVLVRKRCRQLNEVLRPLGFTGLKTFGFGSMTVTYRNCPNTTPLALWAGDPWYPLFPRKTNTQTSASRWFDE